MYKVTNLTLDLVGEDCVLNGSQASMFIFELSMTDFFLYLKPFLYFNLKLRETSLQNLHIVDTIKH